MTSLIISTIFSTILSGGAYYLFKRHKRMAAQPLEPVVLPQMTQGMLDDKPYVIITEDRRLSVYFKTITDESALNQMVRNELSPTYTIAFEDGRLAIHAQRAGEVPIIEDARRLLS